MISALISRLVIVVFGTLYPVYCSYKAVKTKDIKLYVKWMMYWIVFGLFISVETFTDIFVSFWCPFYYEFKIFFVLWLLLPIFKGSNYMYRKVIHPFFTQKEQDIDEMIAKAKEQGCSVLMDIGSKGVTLATNVIMNTAVKGGSGILFQLKKSYSLNDLVTDADMTDTTVDKRKNTKRKEDCRNNFQNVEMNETKMISAGRETNLRMMEEDSNIHIHDSISRSRKLSSESMALEEDCKNVSSNLRPRRSNRQVLAPLGNSATIPRKRQPKKRTL
ncbi:receptor expression-enhancing protein 1-like isoform X2 [Planococcus citri]|uniref:receptor expression-enhancing protein 1-like isoform X2 n=1 Tax=Planococcus citri TaxID=170843 RepID=UPI0031F7BA34